MTNENLDLINAKNDQFDCFLLLNFQTIYIEMLKIKQAAQTLMFIKADHKQYPHYALQEDFHYLPPIILCGHFSWTK